MEMVMAMGIVKMEMVTNKRILQEKFVLHVAMLCALLDQIVTNVKLVEIRLAVVELNFKLKLESHNEN